MTKCTTIAVICVILSLVTNFSHGELSSEKDVKSLKKDLHSKDFDRKMKALYELKSLGIDGAEAMDALVATLDDPEQRIRSIAASTLEAMGKESWPATPKLIKLLSEGTIPRISSDMGGGYPDIGFSAARTLAQIGSESVIPLTTCLTHEKSEVRYFAAYALGEIGIDARSAIPHLLSLLKDHDAMVRGEATRAIGKIGSDTPMDLVPVLEKMLDDKQLNVRFAAVESFGKLCPVSPEAVCGLIKGMRDEKAEVQVHAIKVLGNLKSYAKPAVSEMAEFLVSQDSYKHSHYPFRYPIANVAARSLGEIGPAAKSALPLLLDVICQKNHKYKNGDTTIDNRELRGIAMIAAAHISPDDSRLCNALDKLLDEPDCVVDVANAFGILGAKAKPYIARIEKKIPELKQEERLDFSLALLSIDPNHSLAQQILKKELTRIYELECENNEEFSVSYMKNHQWKKILFLCKHHPEQMKKISPALVLLAQENHYLKEATCCLSYLGSDPENTLSILISLLELAREQAWNDIILAIQHISSSNSPQLLNALQHGSPKTRTGIIKVLARFPDSKPQIIKMLQHRSARVRLAAVRALEQLSKNTNDDVVVHLKGVLNDKSRTVREAAQQRIRSEKVSDQKR